MVSGGAARTIGERDFGRIRHERCGILPGFAPAGALHARAHALLPLALLLVLATAAPAAADSLVYVKDSNVWSARPDGSEQRRLTDDGTQQDPLSPH